MKTTADSGALLGWRAHQIAALLVLMVAVWVSSGTMAPYGATLDTPLVLPPCDYLVNVDHSHFEQTFLMLDGAPKSAWETSVVLRRILFPLLAYPLMKLTTFEFGGFVTSLALHALAFVVFTSWLRRRVGDAGAKAGLWLLATYPGITYWAALPYSYACIVPCCLFGFMLLCTIAESRDTRTILVCSLGLGVLFLGYDLLPFFLPPVAAILISRRNYGLLAAATILLLAPTLVWNVGVLGILWHVSPENPNTGIYVTIFRSYISKPYLFGWAKLWLRFPLDVLRVYFFSNFVFIPVLFALFWRHAMRHSGPALSQAERLFLLTLVGIFLFNNLAPPYPGVQLRGSYIARLYQPAFVALIVFAARFIDASQGRPAAAWARRAVVVAVLLNASVALGLPVDNPLAGYLYLQFYGHGNRDWHNPTINFAKYGHRPIGMCDR
jgi:hypothetical protein